MSQLPEKTFGNSWLGSIQDHKDHPGSIQAIRIGPDVEVEEINGYLQGLKICLQGLASASSCLGYIYIYAQWPPQALHFGINLLRISTDSKNNNHQHH